MPLDFGPYSRFRNDPLITVDGEATLGSWRQPSWLTQPLRPDQIGSFRVISQAEGRPDLISYQLYGTPDLDWVLLAFNRVLQPFGWPRAGDTIQYPVESVVIPEL